MEFWDGYFRNGTKANIDLIRGYELPKRLYHLACEVLVQHEDGDYLLMQRDISKNRYGGYYEATASGAALKGEDKIACIKRELHEETGIESSSFKEIAKFIFDDDQCLFFTFLCITNCDKTSIKLQAGETIAYKWLNEKDFIKFINSEKMIKEQKERYLNYFNEKGYLIPQIKND